MVGVTGDEEVGIGEFALLTGLSITRLRRYHDLGLLVPARVDPLTGYRSYRPDQVADQEVRGQSLTLESLVSFLKEAGMAVYKLPERLEVVIAIPRNSVGKILKAELRKDIAARVKAEN